MTPATHARQLYTGVCHDRGYKLALLSRMYSEIENLDNVPETLLKAKFAMTNYNTPEKAKNVFIDRKVLKA